MTACTLAYGPKVMAKYHITLWDAVKFEILNAPGPEDEIQDEALITIRAIATALAKPYDDGTANLSTIEISPLGKYLKAITKECLEHLTEPQSKIAKPGGRILASVAKAGVFPHNFIIKKTLPTMVTLYEGFADGVDGPAKQRALLEVMSQVFASTLEVFGAWGDTKTVAVENPLVQFKDKLFDIYSRSLMGTPRDEIGNRIDALNGLGTLIRINHLYGDAEIGMWVQYLNDLLAEYFDVRDLNLRPERIRYVFQPCRHTGY